MIADQFCWMGLSLNWPNPVLLHNTATGLADYLLKNLLGSTYWVRIQMPLVLGNWTDPVPDIAVVVGTPDDYPDNPKQRN